MREIDQLTGQLHNPSAVLSMDEIYEHEIDPGIPGLPRPVALPPDAAMEPPPMPSEGGCDLISRTVIKHAGGEPQA